MMRRLAFEFGKSLREVEELSLAELEWWFLSGVRYNASIQPQ